MHILGCQKNVDVSYKFVTPVYTQTFTFFNLDKIYVTIHSKSYSQSSFKT